jgi:aspartate/methionine/tyrosine aminotransferase
VLVPTPSYPLVEHLARLDAVEAVSYPLDAHGGWALDPDAVGGLVTPRTRAVLVVSPNNPTGSVLTRRALDALAEICRDRDLVLVGDEVFADYRFDGALGLGAPGTAAVSVLDQTRCLAVSLGGLSKSIGMPQLKLAWMAVGGPEALAAELVERLAFVGDTYLSVATPVQLALPALFEDGKRVRAAITDRVTANLHALRRAVQREPGCSLVEPAGGWSAVLRVPAREGEEAFALELLERHGTLVTPGYFYDFPFEAFMVVSLLVQPDTFASGLDRLLALASGR